MDKQLELWLVIVGMFAIGMAIGIILTMYSTTITVGDFQMPVQKFESLADAVITDKPFTICEIEGDKCMIMVEINKEVAENAIN